MEGKSGEEAEKKKAAVKAWNGMDSDETPASPLTLTNAAAVHFAGFADKAMALFFFLKDRHPAHHFPDHVKAATDLGNLSPRPTDSIPAISSQFTVPLNQLAKSLETDASSHLFIAALDFHHLWAWSSIPGPPPTADLADLVLRASQDVTGFQLRLLKAAENRAAAVDASLARPSLDDGRSHIRELDADHWRRTRLSLSLVAAFYAFFALRLRPILPYPAQQRLKDLENELARQKDGALAVLKDQSSRLAASPVTYKTLSPFTSATHANSVLWNPDPAVMEALGLMQREAALASTCYITIWQWLASQAMSDRSSLQSMARQFFLNLEESSLHLPSQYHKERLVAVVGAKEAMGTASVDAHLHLLTCLDSAVLANARIHTLRIANYNALLSAHFPIATGQKQGSGKDPAQSPRTPFYLSQLLISSPKSLS